MENFLMSKEQVVSNGIPKMLLGAKKSWKGRLEFEGSEN